MAEMRDIDWSEHYLAIGTFVVEFEKIATRLRFCYNCVLQTQGLKVWDLGANLLSIVTISPESLAVAYGSAMKILSNDTELGTLTDDIYKCTKVLAERRNEIVHGEWRIGPEMVIVGADELPSRVGIKRKSTRAGQRVTQLATIDEISQHIAEARAVVRMIDHAFYLLLVSIDPSDAQQ
ncbi:hypothetical protein [Mesorhizobium sp.]|uniref:hypothetical protein n=1 Tax=Mesorhizobium sp. TaxID=1871066 RepID=UPI000FEA1858|nr:hypothetical protein [Mesorhizobium sp.]RWP64943.1 MAG: hypothetical protein EOR08_08515 [Mesorhizobium sp.]